MSAVDTIQHTAAHGVAGIVEVAKHGWARFAAWRQTERMRQEGLRNMAYMSARDFADIGVSRAAMEFHLQNSRKFLPYD